MRLSRSSDEGFTLIETIIALAILAIAGFLLTKSFSTNYKAVVSQSQKMEVWSLEKQFRDAALNHISFLISNSIDPSPSQTCDVCRESLDEWKIRQNDTTEVCGPIKEKFKNSFLTATQGFGYSTNRLVLLDPQDFTTGFPLTAFNGTGEPRSRAAINRCQMNNYSSLADLSAVRKLNFCFLILPASSEYAGFLKDNIAFAEIVLGFVNLRTGRNRSCAELNLDAPRERGIRGYYSLYYRKRSQPASELSNVIDGAFYSRMNLENP